MKRRNGHYNRRRHWECPYFKWDSEMTVSCDAGRPAFPTKRTCTEYIDRHCAGDWKECSLAKAWKEWAENQ